MAALIATEVEELDTVESTSLLLLLSLSFCHALVCVSSGTFNAISHTGKDTAYTRSHPSAKVSSDGTSDLGIDELTEYAT